jgi:DNA-binding response OmpR family regulator
MEPRLSPDDTAPLILIVEDDQDTREMYALGLTLSDFRIVEATDGEEAFEKARDLRPDLVVTDLTLGGGGGLGLVTRLKEATFTRGIPVIVLTGAAREEQRESALRNGCDLLLTKPCAPDLLAASIRHLLERSASS